MGGSVTPEYSVSLLDPFETGILAADETFFKDVSQFSALEQTAGDLSHTLAAGFLSSVLTELDEMVCRSYARRKDYTIQRHDCRSLISSVGDVTFQSTLFRKQDSGEYIYLTERLLHLPRNEHFTTVAEASVLAQSTVHSYQDAADRLAIGTQKVSRTAVMHKVHAIDAALHQDEEPEEEDKRQCPYLYIEADEDHIHRQEGGRDSTQRGSGNNCFTGKLIYLFEGKEEECSGRRRLIHPFYFGGLYPGSDNGTLWSEVEKYIEAHYDLDCLKHVYINGDGGSWIKAGKDYVYHALLAADKFHLMKYINSACRRAGDDADRYKGEFYKAIWKKRPEKVKNLLNKLERKYGQAKPVDDARTYFDNNWEAIQRAFHDKHALGCSAEGHVSSVLSDRMSSRPMGWSATGSDHMCKLRCYVRNYGRDKIIDLVRWRREKAFETQLLPTGTDGFVEEIPEKHFTKQQREVAAYEERIQATLDPYWTARKALAIREQIGNI